MKPVIKEQFIAVLADAGITEEQKARLHAAFEKRYPEAHQRFLEFLGFPAEAVRDIRAASRKA